jgi:hypothetical protein
MCRSKQSAISGQNARIVYHVYALRDGFQGIMDVAQLSGGNELVTRPPQSVVGPIRPRSRMVHPDEHLDTVHRLRDAKTTWEQ